MGNFFSTGVREKYLSSPDLKSPNLLEDLTELVTELSQHDFAGLVSIGPVGVGKSSALNTVASYLNNRLEQQAGCGHGTSSLTRQKQSHTLLFRGRPLNWKWMDTPGDLFTGLVEAWKAAQLPPSQSRRPPLAPGSAQNGDAVARTSNGVDGSASADPTDAYAKAVEEQLLDAMQAQQIGCVMAMISAVELVNCVELQGPGTVRASKGSRLYFHLQVLKDLYRRLVQRGARMIVILTKCDLIDPAIMSDVSEVQYSHMLHQLRECVVREVGLPLNQVHAVVNLVREFEPMENVPLGYLALFNIRCALAAARHASLPPPYPRQSDGSAGYWDTLTYPSSIVSDDGVSGRSHPVVPQETFSHPGAVHAQTEDNRSMANSTFTDIDSALMRESMQHQSISRMGSGNGQHS